MIIYGRSRTPIAHAPWFFHPDVAPISITWLLDHLNLDAGLGCTLLAYYRLSL